MIQSFLFAVRNVLRNRKRSLLTATAVFFAAMVVVLSQGWVNGIFSMYLDNYIKYQTGHLRVVTPGFIKREKFMPVDELILDSEAAVRKIRSVPGVVSAERRMKFGIILGFGDKTVTAAGMGIDFDKSVLDVTAKVIEGVPAPGDGILIGSGLRKKLGVRPGDPLLLVTKTAQGGLNGIKVPVRGVFRMGVTVIDDKMFFLPMPLAERLLKTSGGVTEILVFSKSYPEALKIRQALREAASPGAEIQSVQDQMKTLYDFLEIGRYIYFFVEALIIFLASFVVINTMMMAIFERIREVGTLKAMGMTDRALFLNFIVEGGVIGAVGGAAGTVAGYLILWLMALNGINFEFAMKDIAMTVEYVMRPSVSADVPLLTFALSVLIPMLATVFPARYAWKMMPSEALRKV